MHDELTRGLTNRYNAPLNPAAGSPPETSVRNEGERRVVTILFCDVAGSTRMAELFDPEDWAEIMSAVFDRLIQPIERYEGTIFRLMGDAVLAIFGAPQAHEDDPHRAILAGLEILDSVQELRQQLEQQYQLDFNVRIGINTGLVVVGIYGSGTTVEYTAMGNAINVAAKLEELADPGTILVGETTYRLGASLFDFESLGFLDTQDLQAPEQMFRVLKRKPIASVYRSANGRAMPFTNRVEEMAILRQAIDDLRYQGRGRVIFIIGDPGVGKSRLIEESRRYALTEEDGGLPIAWLENRISAFESQLPYAALQQRLRLVFNVQRDNSPAEMREKVLHRTTQYPPEFQRRAARVIERVLTTDIGALLSASNSPDFEPDEFRSELYTVMRALIRGWNPGGAILLMSEDNHRADAPSFELLENMYQLISDHPALFISSLRPERDSPIWRKRDEIAARLGDSYTEIWLQPLTETCVEELLDAMIENASTGEQLLKMILARTAGNPHFIEEIIHYLADQGFLERISSDSACCRTISGAEFTDLAIPNSLQGLLLERIDRLPRETRRILEQAAVIGRVFPEQVLRESLGDDGSDLAEHLATLIDLDMIGRLDGQDTEEYFFRHGLLRDVAYSTMLHRQAREFHRRVGAAMEALFQDQPDEYAGQIGSHYFEAADPRAVGWLLQAAEQAEIVFELMMVIDNTTLAIELANKLDLPAEPRAYELRMRAYEQLHETEAAERDRSRLQELTSSNGVPSRPLS